MRFPHVAAALSAIAFPLSFGSAQTIDSPVFCSGAFEVPSNTTTGRADGIVSYDPTTNTISYDIVAVGLTGPATAAHIHRGPVGTNGGVAFGLTSVGVDQWKGTTGPVAAADLDLLLTDGLYVNIHTAAFGGGEIRGQVFMPEFLEARDMSGTNEVPPNSSGGSAVARFRYDAPNRQVDYDVSVANLTSGATAAHVHDAPAGSNGGVVFGLTQTGATTWAGTSPPLTNTQIIDMLTEGYYCNVHTSMFGGGELRDQLRVGTLNTDTKLVGTQNGGVHSWFIDVGPSGAGQLHWVVATFSGTSPGVVVDGVQVDLNPDGWTAFTLAQPNSALLKDTLGVLPADGRHVAGFNVPPLLGAPLAGVTMHSLAVVIDPIAGKVTRATNPVPLTFLP